MTVWRKLIAMLMLWICGNDARSFQAKPMKEDSNFHLTILHVNDIHSHFEEINSYTARCHKDQAQNGQCFGGAARMYTQIHKLVQQNPKQTLILNAGDYYQGTIMYTLFGYEVVAEFSNLLNYTAFGVGNHDFDDGIESEYFLQEIVKHKSEPNFSYVNKYAEFESDIRFKGLFGIL